MTRFQKELSGELGAYWKKAAEKELEKVKTDLQAGRITIDGSGVARNCIGRVLMSDMLEKLAMVTDKVSVEATTAARDKEVSKSLAEYRKNARPVSEEERMEMQAAFGKGTTVSTTPVSCRSPSAARAAYSAITRIPPASHTNSRGRRWSPSPKRFALGPRRG